MGGESRSIFRPKKGGGKGGSEWSFQHGTIIDG